MTATSTLRRWWAPACSGPFATVALHGEGRVTVRSAIVPAVKALDVCLVAHDYRTRRQDTGAYNCRKITGGDGWSLHAYAIALDLNWQSNPYGRRLITDMPPAMIDDIKAIRTNNGKQVWRWGGDYSGNKDAMHFEIVCHPSDLATGIDPASLPTPTDETSEEDDMLKEIRELHEVYLGADPDARNWGNDMRDSYNHHAWRLLSGEASLETIRQAFQNTAREYGALSPA